MDVHVIAMGMATSLGLDVATAAAAARAGVSRARELEYFLVRSADDPSHQGVVGHELPDVTRGFEGRARLLRITQATLSDVLRQMPGTPPEPKRTAFYLSLPDPARTVETPEGEAPPPQDPATALRRGEQLVHAAAKLVGWPGPPTVAFVSTSGHTGVAEALARATADLERGGVRTAIVGGVDSLLEERTLAWLEATGRLKTPRMPAGLPPGEAGALLVLRAAADDGGAVPAATIRALGMGTEPHPLGSGEPSHGTGLVDAFTAVATTAGWDRATSAWVVSDHNGEPYRAHEWGHAVVRLLARWPACANPTLWYPAVSFGDTAGASGGVALCLAARAFVRGYAPGEHAIIASSADGPPRAAVLVSRPQSLPR
jgi:3-oxoacyl-[acyl-carrier-protein] synthase-1